MARIPILGSGDKIAPKHLPGFTAKGDLLVATGANSPARLAAGTNGQSLVADSTQPSGVKWANPVGDHTAAADPHPQYTLETVQAAAGTLAASLTTPGSYYVVGSTAITANGYPTSAGLPGVMTVVGAGTHRVQTFTFAAGANVNQAYVRSSADTGTTWTAWADPALFHEGKTDPHSAAGYVRKSVANTFTAGQSISVASNNPLSRIRSDNPADGRRWDEYIDPTGYWGLIARTDAGANQGVPLILHRDGRASLGETGKMVQLGGVQVFNGTGSPEGVIVAPPGSKYTDKNATNGAVEWVKATGVGNAGWKVTFGDTGWRYVPLTSANVTGFIYMRRVNERVYFAIPGSSAMVGASPGSPETLLSPVPSGFVPSLSTTALYGQNGAPMSRLLNVGAAIQAYLLVANQAIQIPEVSRVTDQTWPTTLPGTAI